MATQRYRRWIQAVSTVVGVGLLVMGALTVLVYVAGFVSGDPDITNNLTGGVALTVVTVLPGWLLVRWGRRGRRATNRDMSESWTRRESNGNPVPGRVPGSGRLRWGRLLLFIVGVFAVLAGGFALLIGAFGLNAQSAGSLFSFILVVALVNVPKKWFRW